MIWWIVLGVLMAAAFGLTLLVIYLFCRSDRRRKRPSPSR